MGSVFSAPLSISSGFLRLVESSNQYIRPSFNRDSYQLGFIMKFLLLLAFAAVAVAVPYKGQITTIKDLFQGKSNERIISGTPAALGQLPWQVAINYETSAGHFFCGGSIISDSWILTAAHCAEGAFRFRIQFGILTLNNPESGSIQVISTEQTIHADYNNVNLNNDVALIRLPQPIEFTDNIKPIKLPSRGQQVGAGESLTVSGWGWTSDQTTTISNTLNFVQLTTISNSECANYYMPGLIIGSTVCCMGAPEHSTCKGDSGGPLVSYDWNSEATLVGVVSFVDTRGCSIGKPSGFARTESFLDWIHDNTGISV